MFCLLAAAAVVRCAKSGERIHALHAVSVLLAEIAFSFHFHASSPSSPHPHSHAACLSRLSPSPSVSLGAITMRDRRRQRRLMRQKARNSALSFSILTHHEEISPLSFSSSTNTVISWSIRGVRKDGNERKIGTRREEREITSNHFRVHFALSLSLSLSPAHCFSNAVTFAVQFLTLTTLSQHILKWM